MSKTIKVLLIYFVVLIFFIPSIMALGVNCTSYNCSPTTSCSDLIDGWGYLHGDSSNEDCGDMTTGITVGSTTGSPTINQEEHHIDISASSGDNSYISIDASLIDFSVCADVIFKVTYADKINTHVGTDVDTDYNDDNGIGACSINTAQGNKPLAYRSGCEQEVITDYAAANEGTINFTFGTAPTAAEGQFIIYNNSYFNQSGLTVATFPDQLYIHFQVGGGDVNDILNLTGIFLYNCSNGFPQGVAATEFTVSAKDQYDSSALSNITVIITNSTFTSTNGTDSGSIDFEDINAGIYNITVLSNQSGGYFNKTYIDYDIATGDLAVTLFQAELRVIARDGFTLGTIPTFDSNINTSSDSTSSGLITFFLKAGEFFVVNVSAQGFTKKTQNISVAALSNSSLTIDLGSLFNFSLIRETTNTEFDFNGTNETELAIVCDNKTITQVFNISAKEQVLVDCTYTLMKMTVDYGALGSYFRTLIPSTAQKNITWYLIDLLQGDVAIQRIITLVDLTGDFEGSTLRVKRSLGTGTVTVIEQEFDISEQVNLFLVKNELYTISIDNGVTETVLGNLIPTEAGSQTITLPNLPFVPDETTLGGDISWSYTSNSSLGVLRLQYVDTTNQTTMVRFTVSDEFGVQLFQGESNANSTVTITYNGFLANKTYITDLLVRNSDSSIINFTESQVFYEFEGGGAGVLDMPGWTIPEQINLKKWFAWIFLAFWGFLFTRRFISFGIISLAGWLWLFKTFQWIEISNLIFGFVVLIAVVTFLVEQMKQN